MPGLSGTGLRVLAAPGHCSGSSVGLCEMALPNLSSWFSLYSSAWEVSRGEILPCVLLKSENKCAENERTSLLPQTPLSHCLSLGRRVSRSAEHCTSIPHLQQVEAALLQSALCCCRAAGFHPGCLLVLISPKQPRGDPRHLAPRREEKWHFFGVKTGNNNCLCCVTSTGMCASLFKFHLKAVFEFGSVGLYSVKQPAVRSVHSHAAESRDKRMPCAEEVGAECSFVSMLRGRVTSNCVL